MMSLALLVPIMSVAAPPPLSVSELNTIKAAAIDDRKSAYGFGANTENVQAARTLIRKLANEGNLEALDLLIALDDPPLLHQYTNDLSHPFPWPEYEARIVKYYDKPIIAADLSRVLMEYSSREVFDLFLGDLKALVEQVQDPSRLSMAELLRVRDRRGSAVYAITRTRIPGIEKELASAVAPVLDTPGAVNFGHVTGFVASRVPSSAEAAQVAVSMLLKMANARDTKGLVQLMDVLIKGLGRALPDALVDLPALRTRVLSSAKSDRQQIEMAFDSAILNSNLLRNPTPDYLENLLMRSDVSAAERRYAARNLKDANAETTHGDHLLRIAISYGDLDVAKLLIELGADPNATGRDKEPALFTLLSSLRYRSMPPAKAAEFAELLLAHGANPNAKLRDGTTPLYIALSNDLNTLAKLLVERGAEINDHGPAGRSPLTVALDRGNWQMQRFLRSRGGVAHSNDHDPIKDNRTYGFSIHEIQEKCPTLPICARLQLREADDIKIDTDDSMRLTYFGDKELLDNTSLGKEKTMREQFVAVVKGGEVFRSTVTVQAVTWHSKGCSANQFVVGLLLGGRPGSPCWNLSERHCEAWGTHDANSFNGSPACSAKP